MKKVIIIDETEKKNGKRFIENRFFEWLLYMIGYAIILILMSIMFKSLKISSEYYGLYSLIASIIIYVLNQTIKPILNYITLPITILSWGLMYPISNVIFPG